MNGIHDCGGMNGLGPIVIDRDEELFSAPWERRAFAMFIAVFAAGVFNVDEFRYNIEVMDPAEYLQSSYYEHWIHSLERMLTTKGILSSAEIHARIDQLKGAH